MIIVLTLALQVTSINLSFKQKKRGFQQKKKKDDRLLRYNKP
jgi:hypothetical protein